MRRAISTNSFNAVAAGQTATLDLPVGDLVYHEIRLSYMTSTANGPDQTNVEAEVTGIRVKANGKTQIELSSEQLIDLNTFYGRPFNSGAASLPAVLPLILAPAGRKLRSAQGEDALAWGTADLATLQVEVDIASGATSPTLSARVVVDKIARPMGPIVKYRKFVVPVSATGIVTVTTFPRNDDYYSLFAWSTNISDHEVKVDQEEVQKLIKQDLQFLLEDNDFTWVAAVYPIKFDFTQRVSDALRMRRADGRPASEFRVDFNMSSAASFTCVAETVGLRD